MHCKSLYGGKINVGDRVDLICKTWNEIYRRPHFEGCGLTQEVLASEAEAKRRAEAAVAAVLVERIRASGINFDEAIQKVRALGLNFDKAEKFIEAFNKIATKENQIYEYLIIAENLVLARIFEVAMAGGSVEELNKLWDEIKYQRFLQ
jgi:hypothetical protein